MERELAALFEMHGKRIYQYFLLHTGNAHTAEELAQETFYQAVVSVWRFRGECSDLTWLLAVARNVFRRYLRSGSKVYVELNEQIPDKAESPLCSFLRREEAAEIAAVFDQMPEHFALILMMKHMEDMKVKEIAGALSRSESWVKVNLHRARKMFELLSKRGEC